MEPLAVKRALAALPRAALPVPDAVALGLTAAGGLLGPPSGDVIDTAVADIWPQSGKRVAQLKHLAKMRALVGSGNVGGGASASAHRAGGYWRMAAGADRLTGSSVQRH